MSSASNLRFFQNLLVLFSGRAISAMPWIPLQCGQSVTQQGPYKRLPVTCRLNAIFNYRHCAIFLFHTSQPETNCGTHLFSLNHFQLDTSGCWIQYLYSKDTSIFPPKLLPSHLLQLTHSKSTDLTRLERCAVYIPGDGAPAVVSHQGKYESLQSTLSVLCSEWLMSSSLTPLLQKRNKPSRLFTWGNNSRFASLSLLHRGQGEPIYRIPLHSPLMLAYLDKTGWVPWNPRRVISQEEQVSVNQWEDWIWILRSGPPERPPECLRAYRGNSLLMITAAPTLLHTVRSYLIASFAFKPLTNHKDRQENMIKQPRLLIRGGPGKKWEDWGWFCCSPWGIGKEVGCIGTVYYLLLNFSRQVHLNRQIHRLSIWQKQREQCS